MFDGDLAIVTYADLGQAGDPADAGNVAFSQASAAGDVQVMAYDVRHAKGFERGENPFHVALRGCDADEIQTRWHALSDGASVLIPIGPAAFSPLHGMLTDRFGVT